MTGMSKPLHKNQVGQASVNGGHFAAKTNDESPVILALPAATVRVRREAWDGRDNLIELDVVEFDGRAILDTLGVDDIDPDETDNDDIFYTAQRLGLVDHDGPFTVYLDDPSVEAYVEARRAAGAEDAISEEPRRSMQQLQAARAEIEEQRRALEDRSADVAVEAVTQLILKERPTAEVVELYETFDGDLRIGEIRDSAGAVLWNASTANPDENRFGENEWLEGVSISHPRIAHDDQDKFWDGFTI